MNQSRGLSCVKKMKEIDRIVSVKLRLIVNYQSNKNQMVPRTCASKGVDFDDFAGFDIVANDSELLVSQTQETIIGHESNETLLAGGSIGEQFVH